MQTYQKIAGLIAAIENCERTRNHEWREKHRDALAAIMRDYLPHGSGFDAGTDLDDSSAPDRVRFITSFHHMNDAGMYDGWTEHTVTMRPSLVHGFVLDVSGRDRNGIKDYILDTFYAALSADLAEE